MSGENLKAWERAIAAFNERNAEGMMAVCSADVEFRPLLAGVRHAPYRGLDGVREFLAATDDAFEYFQLDLKHLEDHGGFVLASCVGRARGRASGAEIERAMVHIAKFEDGRCVWWRTFQTREEALEAGGLQA
jgi:ketosteroid isomerase-like protein